MKQNCRNGIGQGFYKNLLKKETKINLKLSQKRKLEHSAMDSKEKMQ